MRWLTFITNLTHLESPEESPTEGLSTLDWPLGVSVEGEAVVIKLTTWKDSVHCGRHHSLGRGPDTSESGEAELSTIRKASTCACIRFSLLLVVF